MLASLPLRLIRDSVNGEMRAVNDRASYRAIGNFCFGSGSVAVIFEGKGEVED